MFGVGGDGCVPVASAAAAAAKLGCIYFIVQNRVLRTRLICSFRWKMLHGVKVDTRCSVSLRL